MGGWRSEEGQVFDTHYTAARWLKLAHREETGSVVEEQKFPLTAAWCSGAVCCCQPSTRHGTAPSRARTAAGTAWHGDEPVSAELRTGRAALHSVNMQGQSRQRPGCLTCMGSGPLPGFGILVLGACRDRSGMGCLKWLLCASRAKSGWFERPGGTRASTWTGLHSL